MAKPKKLASNNFKAKLDLLESREHSFSLYLIITTLILVVIISMAVTLDAKEATCPYPPHEITLFMPLRSDKPHVVSAMFSRLERGETPGFNVVWSGNYSQSPEALELELARHPWQVVEYKDTKNNILRDNSMSLKTVTFEDDAGVHQLLCEQDQHRCPTSPQIDLPKPLTAFLDPFGSEPVYQRCLSEVAKADAAEELKSIVSVFPKGIHPGFFAASGTKLVPKDRFRTRQAVIAKYRSSWIQSKKVELSLMEVQQLPTPQPHGNEGDKKADEEADKGVDFAALKSQYVLTLSGWFKDPYTAELEHYIVKLRDYYLDMIGGSDDHDALLDTRARDGGMSFLEMIQHSPLLPSKHHH